MATRNTLENKRRRRDVRTYCKNLAAKLIPFSGVLAPNEPANPAPNVKWLRYLPLASILALHSMQSATPRRNFTLTRRRDSRTGRMSIYA